jgi:predicted nucleotidyltransferase
MNVVEQLSVEQNQALQEIRTKIKQRFEIEAIYLFGSVLRGEADDESDIDMLILTKNPLDRNTRHEITDIVFEVNLEYQTNFSTLVIDEQSWQNGPISVLPIHADIQKEGIRL